MWHFEPEDKPDMVRGTDVIIIKGGKIKALRTTIDNAPGKECLQKKLSTKPRI